MATITPKKITTKILDLCDGIICKSIPEFIPIKTMKNAVLNDCFSNVKTKIVEDGGTIQYGWCIWEWKNVMVEAEFHAVWCSSNGGLVCVSPHDNEKEILFLPDDRKQFNGIDRTDNIRKSLRTEHVVDEFIQVCKELYAEKERLTKGKLGLVSMDVTPELRIITKRYQMLKMKIEQLPSLPKPNNFCPCGSGKKYKGCCP